MKTNQEKLSLDNIDNFVTDLKGNIFYLYGDIKERTLSAIKTREYWKNKVKQCPSDTKAMSHLSNWTHICEQIELLDVVIKESKKTGKRLTNLNKYYENFINDNDRYYI